MIEVLLIAVAGGLGAVARLVVDGRLRGYAGRYPIGTAVVNLSGSLLLGLVTGLALGRWLGEEWALVLGTGLLGGYTTFSTASVETVRLAEQGDRAAALVNAVGMLTASVLLAALGWWLATLL